MLRLETFVVFLLIISRMGFAQPGHLSHSDRYAKEMQPYIHTFHLTDFQKSKPDFGFRMLTPTYLLEITKYKDSMGGQMVYYVFYAGNTRSQKLDTIYRKMPLDRETAKKIYNLIRQSEVRNIPSSDQIKNWGTVADGSIYFMQFYDDTASLYKKYDTPGVYRAEIPETAKVTLFINSLENMLHTKEQYLLFERNLPRKGCYLYGYIICYRHNDMNLKISGGYPWPVGLSVSYSWRNIGSYHPNIFLSAQYLGDFHRGYEFSFAANKSVLFFKSKKVKDYMDYSFRQRERKTAGENLLREHKWIYGLAFRPINLHGGLIVRRGAMHKTGPVIGWEKDFSFPGNWRLSAGLDYFDKEWNGRMELSKSVHPNNWPLITFSLSAEQWASYRQVLGGVSVRFFFL